jgi:acyl carrier protein
MYENLVEVLVTHFAVDRAEITQEATFAQLKMDSLFLVELLLVVQSEFGVKVSDDAASLTDTVGQMAELLENQTKVSAQ